jgi:hypothetical protein
MRCTFFIALFCLIVLNNRALGAESNNVLQEVERAYDADCFDHLSIESLENAKDVLVRNISRISEYEHMEHEYVTAMIGAVVAAAGISASNTLCQIVGCSLVIVSVYTLLKKAPAKVAEGARYQQWLQRIEQEIIVRQRA